MSHSLATHRRRLRVEWLGMGLSLVLFGAVLIGALVRERHLVEALEGDRLQVQARVVDENLIRQLDGVNNALTAVRDGLEHAQLVPAGAATSARLTLLSDAMPGVRTMVVVDARGVIVASSRAELMGLNSAKRDFFSAPQKQPDHAVMYVSAPFRSPLGPLVIAVGRSLSDAHGAFAGVVVATLDPDYFDVVLRSVLYAPDMRAAITHAEGQVFVTMPPDGQGPGSNLAEPGSVFARHRESGRIATLSTASFPGAADDRMIALRTIARANLRMDKPLVVAVDRELSALGLPWRHQAWRFGLLWGAAAVASALALHFSQRRRRVLDRLATKAATERLRADAELAHTAAMLRQSEEQLRQVTDSLPVLISRWDMDQRFRFANRAYGEWLGIEPASLLGRSVREVYGEQVYDEIQPHIQAASAGTRVHYEREIATLRGPLHVEVTLIPQRGSDGSVQGVCGLISDLTARHRAEQQRARGEERLTLALEGSGLALFDWDIPGDRIYHSAQASAMRDEPAVETTASASTWRSYVHADDLPAMQASIKAALAGEVPVYHAEFRIRKRFGDWLWTRARGRVVERDAAGRAVRLAGTYADIHARRVADDELRRRAEFDALTDLPNRTSFVERLQKAMARATRASPMALLFLDIDHFKDINDTLGHEAGDQLLKVFATRMRDSVRQSDTVARLAGDEFTVILEGLRGTDDATTLAANLIEMLRAPISLAGQVFVITASIGIAMPAEGDCDDAELLRRADTALYEAKRRGRNGYFLEAAGAWAAPLDALRETTLTVRH